MDREYMSKINHFCQVHNRTVRYVTINVTGPPHDPEFTVAAKIDGEEYGRGTGKSKKEAKAVAAKETWEMIEKQPKSPSNMAAAELPTTQPTSSPALDKDYVSLLNIFSQRTHQIVDYPNQTRTGDAHAPTFSVSCTVSGHLYGRGTGPTLAAAKQAAAKEAYEKMETERSNGSCTFSKYSNSSQVPAESDSDKNSICFVDSSVKLVEKMQDMAICEKPSPSQRNAQSSVLKPPRKLAANFANVRNKEEKKNVSNSNECLPAVDTNIGEENGSPHTVNKTFLELFEKIEPIGAGGFGNVFKATSKCDKTTYAIKRVEFTEKVEREARGLARLTHENIVRYHCSWKGNDHFKYPHSSQNSDQKIFCLFIQMEFCEQGTLENWIAKTCKDRKYHEMAQNKFLQIVKGVEYIHSEEFIHRDLKPQNIFISHDNKIKIGDFGLVTSVTFETLTENRGTKSYMAPEQTGARYGKEVDIYALGLIWFEILSACTCHEKTKKIKFMDGRVLSRHALAFTAQWSKKSFHQIKTLAVFQDENKGDLEHISLSETDIISKRNPMLLKLFKKSYPVWPSVREGSLPEHFNSQFPTEASIIKKMLSTKPSGRITISYLLDLVKSVDKEKALRNFSY